MKIAQIGLRLLSIPSPRGGAIEKRIYELSKEVAKRHEVHVYSVSNKDSSVTRNNVHFHYINCNCSLPFMPDYLYYYRLFKVLKRDLTCEKYDVIHLHASALLSLFCKMKYRSNIRTISTVDFPKIGPYIVPGMQDPILTRVAINSLDAVTCVSAYSKRIFLKYNGFYKGNIAVIPNGVNLDKYKPCQELREEYRHKYDLEGKNVLLFVGRICPQKGVHVLLKAYELIAKKSKNYKLLVIGPASGQFHSKKETSYARFVLDKIRRLGGIYLGVVSEETLIGAYNASDMLVLPTLEWEMFGMVMLEAMACGKIVVASHHGGIPEVLKGTRAATTFRPGDYVQLAARIQYYTGMLDEYSNEARMHAKKYSWENVAFQFTELYQKLVEKNDEE